jgi:dihydrofolate reductase
MRKVKAAINMTLDGYCDHTAVTPDEEIHQHFADILNGAGVILYGRITYQLMLFWKNLIEHPSGEKSMDDFAIAIDRIPKIVFSNTIKDTEWGSATLATKSLEEYVMELKQQPGGDILVGCRSLIIQLLKANLIDELQLCIHPVIAGEGLPLFEDLTVRKEFNLIKSKSFVSGAIALYYQPAK